MVRLHLTHLSVIIGGGFAFTTLRSLATYMLKPDHRGDYGDITVIYSARNPGLLMCKDELAEWDKRPDIDLVCTVDRPVDGWTGKVGFTAAATREVSPGSENSVAIICGPPMMIKTCLSSILAEKVEFEPLRPLITAYSISSFALSLPCIFSYCPEVSYSRGLLV